MFSSAFFSASFWAAIYCTAWAASWAVFGSSFGLSGLAAAASFSTSLFGSLSMFPMSIGSGALRAESTRNCSDWERGLSFFARGGGTYPGASETSVFPDGAACSLVVVGLAGAARTYGCSITFPSSLNSIAANPDLTALADLTSCYYCFFCASYAYY